MLNQFRKVGVKSLILIILSLVMCTTLFGYGSFVEGGLLSGDVNGDNLVNAIDALQVLKHAARIEVLSGEVFSVGDMDSNGTVDASDALIILKKVAKIDDSDSDTDNIKPTESVITTYYTLNTNSKKIHYSDCVSAKKISEENKAPYSGDLDVLINQGYSKCKNCFK